ncbi:MAG: glycosyltransferase family 4 protein [Thermoleophilia bacterium]
MRVVVLTTSYPRHPGDHAGRFVADAVERLRARGVSIDVLGPGAYDHHGLADGHGVAANVRRRPWAAPLLLGSMARAVRAAARDADLVHAHWLPSGAAALAAGKPVVVTVHGSDLALAARAPWLARPVLRRAAAVVCVSEPLAREAARLGARDPVVVPNGVEVPDAVGPAAEPPEVLFAGRLSPEKGIEELAEATRGLRRVVVGDGPLRHLLPDARGFVDGAELRRCYARAAVVCCPSRREGFGIVCAEAMAHGRPVVASAVGGLADLVVDGETGLLVPPRDPAALRAALDRLLADAALRARLGAAGRERIAALCGWEAVLDRTLTVYERVLSR